MLEADDGIMSLTTSERNCLFPEENTVLKIYTKYSYFNCKFECAMFYAQNEVFKKYKKLCQPWHFPATNASVNICDPWQAFDFWQIMSNQIPDGYCSYCLPDCTQTQYFPALVAEPFDSCDSSNLGMSRFCNYDPSHPMTEKFMNQILMQYMDPDVQTTIGAPDYLYKSKTAYLRYFDKFTHPFKLDNYLYDAFDKDIAMVQIFYQKPTVVLMGSQLNMTWIDFFSTVGGLLGLVLGMGIISFVELFWLGLRVLARHFNLTHWIP